MLYRERFAFLFESSVTEWMFLGGVLHRGETGLTHSTSNPEHQRHIDACMEVSTHSRVSRSRVSENEETWSPLHAFPYRNDQTYQYARPTIIRPIPYAAAFPENASVV